MSVYYPSFNYLGINSRNKNLIITNLDGGDRGESDSFLGMDPIYTDSSDGTRRIDYGAKYNNVAMPKITVIKQDGGNMSFDEIRDCLKWLTGSRKTSPLDIMEHFEDRFVSTDGNASFILSNHADTIYSVHVGENQVEGADWSYDVNTNTLTLSSAPDSGITIKVAYNKIKFSFVGRVTNVWQHKMDARTIGLVIEFTSISPWAISPVQRVVCDVNGTEDEPTVITVTNMSDDVNTYVYMKTTYTNADGNSLVLTNTNIGDQTTINNLAANEVVTMEGNQIITSDKPARIFGSDFNFNFPRLAAGDNVFNAIGTGHIMFEYTVPMKVGDCAMSVSSQVDPICGDGNTIVIETLDWNRLSNVPEMYTKSEVDALIGGQNISEDQLNQMLTEVLGA